MATKELKKKKTIVKTPLAIHAKHKDGVHHLVGVENIRVVIVPDGKFWFAQGIDIDYAAQGKDVEAAKSNFERGLTATINQHLRIHNDISRVLKVAPPEILGNLLRDTISDSIQIKLFSQVCTHEIHQAIPSGNIQYLVATQAA